MREKPTHCSDQAKWHKKETHFPGNRIRERSSPLLAGSVPNLGLHDLIIDPNAASGELNANGRFGLQTELILGEPGKKIGFADARVSDQDHLEEVVIVIFSSVSTHVFTGWNSENHRKRRWEMGYFMILIHSMGAYYLFKFLSVFKNTKSRNECETVEITASGRLTIVQVIEHPMNPFL